MANRRDFLKVSALAAGGTLFPVKWTRSAFAQVRRGTLPPDSIRKYQLSLVIPPAMRRTNVIPQPGGGTRPVNYYEIAVRQFKQQILAPGLPTTTVWSYGSINHPETSIIQRSPLRRDGASQCELTGSTNWGMPTINSCLTCCRWIEPSTEPTLRAIHIHEVVFQMVHREPMEDGKPRPPEAWESGYKDTVIAYPDSGQGAV